MIVSLIERLRRAGLALDVRGFFSTPVLSDMAQAIEAHQDKPTVWWCRLTAFRWTVLPSRPTCCRW
nr:hypothetical protein [Pectobacterium brasiliense]